MKYLVLGSGLMGRAVAYDLLRDKKNKEIRLADIDLTRAEEVANWLADERIKPMKLDVKDKGQVLEAMKGVDSVIACISYNYNFDLTKSAIASKANMCDLGGNKFVVEKQFTLSKEAEEAGVTIIPDCGLAPGVCNIIIAAGVEEFDEIEEIHHRVGGLPQEPKPPLNYSLIFSVQGLTNEYIEEVDVIRNGKLAKVEPLTEIEEIIFPEPFGALEAFQTSGGTSTMINTFLGKVKELDYKTIRYKGHCIRMKTMFDIGFDSYKEVDYKGCKVKPREFLELMLVKELTHEDNKDVTLVRVEVIGTKDGKKLKKTYQIIDYYDLENNLTSMMRMTAFPASIIAQMMAKGEITKKGVVTQEFTVPSQQMLKELRSRGIVIDEKIEELK